MPDAWSELVGAAALALGLALGGLWLRARRVRASARATAAAQEPRAGAADALLRVVRSELERSHNEAAVAHWLALAAAGLDAHADPALAIRMAALLRDCGRREAAAAALRCALDRADAPDGLAIAARVARAAADLDVELATAAAGRALGSEELGPLDRRDLERLVATLCGGPAQPGAADADAPDPAPAAAEVEPAPVAAAAEVEPAPVAAGDARASADRTGDGRRSRPEPIELGHHARRLDVTLATPLALEAAGLRVALASGERRLVGWREVDAIAVGAIEGLGPKPVLVVDLVSGWRQPPGEPLRIVRLRGDGFDPRKVLAHPGSPVDALRELVDRLLGETGADPLPDLPAARGRPFAGFRDLTAFEEDVLVAEEGGSAASSGR